MAESYKISLPIIFLLGILVLAVDLLEIFLTFIGVIPVFTPIALWLNWLFDILVWSLVQFYFYLKGARSSYFLAGSILELIPVIDVLPLRSVTFFLSVYLTNHPELATEISSVSAKIKKPALNKNSSSGSKSSDPTTASGRKIISPAQNV